MTKRDPKAAQAMDRIRAEFDAATNKLVDQAILLKYVRKEYNSPIQTTEALYSVFFYSAKHAVKVVFGDVKIPGISDDDIRTAIYEHIELCDPSVIEHAKAAVLFHSRETFPVDPPTVEAVYKLFKREPHSFYLLRAREMCLSYAGKQSHLDFYHEVKELYRAFPANLVYLNSSDPRNSRIRLQGILMLTAHTLHHSFLVPWGKQEAVKHFEILMSFKNGDPRTKSTQTHIRYLRKRLSF